MRDQGANDRATTFRDNRSIMGFYPTSFYVPKARVEELRNIVLLMRAERFMEIANLPVDSRPRQVLAGLNFVALPTIADLTALQEHEGVKRTLDQVIEHTKKYEALASSVPHLVLHSAGVEARSQAVAHNYMAHALFKQVALKLGLVTS